MVEWSYDRMVWGRQVQCHRVRGRAVVRSDSKDTSHATEAFEAKGYVREPTSTAKSAGISP